MVLIYIAFKSEEKSEKEQKEEFLKKEKPNSGTYEILGQAFFKKKEWL